MSINGKYETFESETFTIQLSMADLIDLDLFFRHQVNAEVLERMSRVSSKKFIEMVHQAANGTEFGFDYFHIDK